MNVHAYSLFRDETALMHTLAYREIEKPRRYLRRGCGVKDSLQEPVVVWLLRIFKRRRSSGNKNASIPRTSPACNSLGDDDQTV